MEALDTWGARGHVEGNVQLSPYARGDNSFSQTVVNSNSGAVRVGGPSVLTTLLIKRGLPSF